MINRTQEDIMKNWGDFETPLVSIQCCTYNQEKYIGDALDGFLMQKTSFPFEVIVHDDASTDNTADIIREYEKLFPNVIKPIYETENQYSKHDGSLSRIMRNASKGKYIATCEGDDYWIDENKLQMQVDGLENNKNCSISFCKILQVNKKGDSLNETIPFKDDFFNTIVTLKDYAYVQYFLGHWAFQTSGMLYKRNLISDYDNRDECFKMFPFGDMPLQLYLLLKGNAFYIDRIMSRYRVFSGGYNSEMLKNREKNKENQLKLKNAIDAFDKFTSFEFHEYIKVWSNRLDIEIKCLSGDVKGVFSKANKEYLKKMGMLFCIKLYCRTKFPEMYFKIGCLKRIIKGK